MTTATANSETTVLRALTKVHAKRFARHPLFLVGLVATFGFLIFELIAVEPGTRQAPWTATFFFGVMGLVIAYRLTRTEDRALALLPSAPSTMTTRTLALCGACLVPAAAGFVYFVINSIDWLVNGLGVDLSITDAESFIWAFGVMVVSPLGGSLLGVTVGRWWRFPGAGVIVATVLVLVCFIGVIISATAVPQTTMSNLIGWIMPWQVPWVAIAEREFVPREGAVLGHLIYQIGLCLLAIWAAVIKGAEHGERPRWRRNGLVAMTVALVGLAWAFFG